MDRRFGISTVVVAALVLIAGCSAPLQSGPGTAAADTASHPAVRTVSTAGTGAVAADADRAVVTVAVTARGASADAVRDRVAANATRMREALRAAGVADDELQTVSFRLSSRLQLDPETGVQTIAGYEAVHAHRIETTPSAAGEIVDTAVDNRATEVSGVAFTLSDEARTELRSQALERAMTDARADADVVAEAAGLAVTGVRSASIGSSGPIYAVRESAAEGAGSGTQFDAGPVTVTARVDVTYTVA